MSRGTILNVSPNSFDMSGFVASLLPVYVLSCVLCMQCVGCSVPPELCPLPALLFFNATGSQQAFPIMFAKCLVFAPLVAPPQTSTVALAASQTMMNLAA